MRSLQAFLPVGRGELAKVALLATNVFVLLVPGLLKRHVGIYELMLVAAGGLALSTVRYAFVDRVGSGSPRGRS